MFRWFTSTLGGTMSQPTWKEIGPGLSILPIPATSRPKKSKKPQVDEKGFGTFKYTAESKSRIGVAVPCNSSYREVKRYAYANGAFWKTRSGKHVAGVWVSSNHGFHHNLMTSKEMKRLFGKNLFRPN